MKLNFEYCSIHYSRQWLSNERDLHLALRSNDVEEVYQGLTNAVKFFMVARNLPRKFDVGLGMRRYEPLLKEFVTHSEHSVSDMNFIDILDHFQSAISMHYGGKKLISLASKLLWLRYQDPFIIYDSRVRSSLKVSPGDYTIYINSWMNAFRSYQGDISEVCTRLPSVYRYMDIEFDEADFGELKEISKEKWFQKRVFDIYLWHLAGLGASKARK